jgi:hypothetical protein
MLLFYRARAMTLARDWTRIKADYVEGVPNDDDTAWLSLDAVADRHGIARSTVHQRAAHDGWSGERAAFQHRVEAQRQAARATEMARVGGDLDIDALTLARDGLTLCAGQIIEMAEGRVPIDSRELVRLAKASAEWYGLGLRAVGATPMITVDVTDDVFELSEYERDQRARGILAILRDAGVLPAELDVIDLSEQSSRDAQEHQGRDDCVPDRHD